MEVTGKKESKIVLTKPFSLEGESELDPGYRAPNLLRRLLSLLKNVRPGSDLTHFQVSSLFNLVFFLQLGPNLANYHTLLLTKLLQ